MKKFAVIVAGGAGTRMQRPIPKQFITLHGKPLLWYSVEAFLKSWSDMQVILVLPGHSIGTTLTDFFSNERIILASGGETRFHSVRNGLAKVDDNSLVFVHDGVRCLVSIPLIQRCGEQAMRLGSAIPAIVATDSMRIVKDEGHSIVDRQQVRLIQTPQTFRSELLLPAFRQTYQPAFTDEATVVEANGEKVFLIEGEYDNIKITRPADLLIAERILGERLSL